MRAFPLGEGGGGRTHVSYLQIRNRNPKKQIYPNPEQATDLGPLVARQYFCFWQAHRYLHSGLPLHMLRSMGFFQIDIYSMGRFPLLLQCGTKHAVYYFILLDERFHPAAIKHAVCHFMLHNGLSHETHFFVSISHQVN